MGYRLFTAAVLALTFLAAPASGSDFVRFDATWWSGLDEGQKIGAVQGMITGEQYAYAAARLQDLKDLGDDAKVNAEAFRALKTHGLSFSKTFGTYIDEINDFYVNNPNSARVVGAVMACYADKPVGGCENANE